MIFSFSLPLFLSLFLSFLSLSLRFPFLSLSHFQTAVAAT